MIGTAHADACRRRLNQIILFVGFTDLSGNGANTALIKFVRGTLVTVFFAIETVGRNGQTSIWPHDDRAAIFHFELRQARQPGQDHIAFIDFHAFDGRTNFPGRAFHTHVAVDELELAGRRKRCAGKQHRDRAKER